ncbi:MAG: YhgE/Pip domain-containing protein [Propionicimonas sp.]|jgi:putative membrane protein
MIIERVNSKPARWTTLVGLILVPVLIAGGLLWAGWSSSSRLQTVQAAVVNLDEPVTLGGTYIPLGRQLTANLVDSDRTENLNWVLADEDGARQGLATGRYAAMVTIPREFSTAATSYAGDAEDAERATIRVQTSPVAGVADATLGKVVAHVAATTLNETLTSTYLDNIYVGFNDMGDQFVTMADGAAKLADGTEELADGLSDASKGALKLSGGSADLAEGLQQLATGTARLPKDTRKLADGTGQYVDGVNQLVDTTLGSLDDQQTLASGVSQLASGAGQLSNGLGTYQSGLEASADAAASGAKGIQQLAAGVAGGQVPVSQLTGAVNQACSQLNATDATVGELAGVCIGSLQGAAAALTGAAAGLDQRDDATGESLKSGASQLAGGLSTLSSSLDEALADADGSAKQLKQLRAGGTALAKGTDQLADAMPALVDGIAQTADGSSQLASGVDQLSAGLVDAASGGKKLATGSRKMADGIADGKDKLPDYSSESVRKNLADVVAEPVATENLEGVAGASAGWASLLLVLSLWLGAMATYLVVRAIGAHLLNSSRSNAYLVAEALVPGFVVLGVQALVVTGIGQLALGLPTPKLVAVGALMLLAGATFVVVNHALVAWLGGVGRLVAIGFTVLSVAAAMTSAAPAVFDALRVFSPISPALDAIRAVLTDSSGAVTSTYVLLGWLIAGLAASAIAVVRQRTTTLTDLATLHGLAA